MTTKLPIVQTKSTGALRRDGGRDFIHPADVSGRFVFRRNVVYAVLIGVYALLPWINVGGHPAVFIDIAHRQFYLFGFTFNAQDLWLLFFLLSGSFFALLFLTALVGRVWCGYACPQTVFLEGVFRKIERWVEGPRAKRLKRNAGPWTGGKLGRKLVKHFLYITVAAIIAHIFISYFVSLPRLYEMVQSNPTENWQTFVWATVITGALYGNYAWFREQLCVIICPYGRLQSVLMDENSLVIGYDENRGEPRGKAKDASKGDCVDCGRCSAVCPTGIDIRDGLQLDCIACAACIDACDEIMDKLKRPRGLVRYDSMHGLRNEKTTIMRPRIWLYMVLGLVGLVVAFASASGRTSFEANLVRVSGAPYIIEDGQVRNAYELHLVNKEAVARNFAIETENPDMTFTIPEHLVKLGPQEDRRIPIFVSMEREGQSGRQEVIVRVTGEENQSIEVRGVFVAPWK